MFWIFLASWGVIAAQAAVSSDKIRGYIHEDELSVRVLYSECHGGDLYACQPYALTCYRDDNLLTFDIFSKFSQEAASILVADNAQSAEGDFLLAGGDVRLKTPITSITLAQSLHGSDWELSLAIGKTATFLSLISPQTAAGSSFTVAGVEYPLTPGHEDSTLVMFKEKCIALNEFTLG